MIRCCNTFWEVVPTQFDNKQKQNTLSKISSLISSSLWTLCALKNSLNKVSSKVSVGKNSNLSHKIQSKIVYLVW